MAYRTYEKRLKELVLFHLGKRRLWRKQIAVFPHLNRHCREGDGIFFRDAPEKDKEQQSQGAAGEIPVGHKE